MVKKKTAETISSLYLKIRKSFLSKFLYKKFHEKYTDNGEWDKAKNKTAAEFSNIINKYDYKADLFGGLVDFSHPENEPQYFFADLKHNRDCDNWSREWKIYLNLHNDLWEDVTEVVVFSRDTLITCFTTSHFITVAKNKVTGKWQLFNYYYSAKQYDSKKEAILGVCRNSGSYTEENIIYKEY